MRDEFPKTHDAASADGGLATLALVDTMVGHVGLHEGSVEESGERQAIGRLGSVLLVEADPDQQWRLARDLTRAGARVVGTSSGDGALALVREWDVDLVLVADELPGMDGFEVCRRVAECKPELPLYMMSDVVSDSLHASARAAGASACLTKPIDLPSLATRLSQRHAAHLSFFESQELG